MEKLKLTYDAVAKGIPAELVNSIVNEEALIDFSFELLQEKVKKRKAE